MPSPSSVKDLKQNPKKNSERSKGCVSLPFLGPSRVGAACPAITLRRGKDKSKKPMRKKDEKIQQIWRVMKDTQQKDMEL